jgi:2-C-methyl-D-erythritol 4-phosphate cytidylyltransferase
MSVSLFAVIVAGGSGVRMGSQIPKQFLELCRKPVLMHSITAFTDYRNDIHVVVVLPGSQTGYWKELCLRYNFVIPHELVEGGDTRFHSVRAGLSALPDTGLVAVHDGVRPLVSRETIDRCFQTALQYTNAVPTIKTADSIREIAEDGSRIIDRSKIRMVQTPQVFDLSLLKEAYKQEYTDDFTDDASVFERAGNTIRLTEGNVENIKITTPYDLLIAEATKQI